MPKYVVLHLEDAAAWRDGGEFTADRFREPGEEWEVYQVARDCRLPRVEDDVDGYVITGSHYNLSDPVTHHMPWIVGMVDFLRAVLQPAAAPAVLPSSTAHSHDSGATSAEHGAPRKKVPRVVGICFGAQLIAHAFGGTVANNPGKAYLLRGEKIYPTAAFAKLPIARNIVLDEHVVRDITDDAHDVDFDAEDTLVKYPLTDHMRILVSHGDCVAELPPGAVHLGDSASCKNEVFMVGTNILGLQSHPEFTMEVVFEKIWPVAVERKAG